jgi:peptidoglycan/LPS O-acetylase OafA/YrhL
VRGFDGLRGIAVIIVVVAHLEVILPLSTLLVVPGGTVSLDAFFVLSGFLITALLLREQAQFGGIGRLAFYGRRAVRLLPALCVVVVANAVFAAATHTWASHETSSIISVAAYYSNYFVASSPNGYCANLAPGFQHMWSLSFEEQFYFLWPWITIAFLTVRTRLRVVVPVLLGAIALIAVHRALAYHGIGSWCALFHRTDTRADSILWGALLAHIWFREREPVRGTGLAGWIALAFLVACLPFADLFGPFLYRGGLVAIDAACAVVLLAILNGQWGARRFFEFRPLVALGVVSYAFYLWHMPVYYGVRHFDAGWSNPVRVAVAMVVTLVLTLISWFTIERPLMRWKTRAERQRRERKEAALASVPGVLARPLSVADAEVP